MAKIKSVEDYEMEGYDLPEIEVVAKDKSKPQTYTHTPTAAEVYDGKLTADAQTYVPTSEESTVVETKSEPRVRRQRNVSFGEGLAKVASVMGMGQGDGGRDRVAAREQRAAERRERQEARQDARQAVRDERQALRDARVAENRENRLNAQQVRRDARDVARMEREQSRLDRAKERAARVEEIARRRGAREAARVEAENTRDANRAARREANEAARQERVDARVERREARQERMEGKPQGLSRLEAPTNDAPTEVAVPSDKAPSAKAYGVTTIEEPNVQRRPSGEGGTTAEQREITDAEAREMRGYAGGESAAANQGAERKVTYIEEPNVQRRPVANEDETVTEDKPISDEEARKMRGYGDGTAPESVGGYEDPYKDAYEYKQKLSNEIDYSDNAKRAEMERAHQEWLESDPYRNSDEFKVQLTDDITAKPAGSTAGTETTEGGDGVTTTEGGAEGGTTGSEGNGTTTEGGGTTTTTEGGNGTEGGDQGGDDDSKLSDAEWINKYMKDLGFDKEEVERQKKAAKWAVAAQMLADSIGALSNVYWTGKGADAMKFEPGAPKAAAAANKMYADIREAREKALKAALDERKTQFDMEMAKKNLDLNVKKHEFDKKKHEDDQIIKLGNLEISREKLNNDKEYQTQILDLRMQELMQQGEKAKDAFAISMEELGLKREQLKLSKEELAARVDGSYYADTQGVPKKQQFNVGGKTVSFDNFSEAQMYQIYNALPEEVKEKVGKGKFTYDKYGNLIGDPNGTPEPKDILHAIHANTNDPNVARAIAQAAGDQELIDAYGKVIADKADADAAAAERKRSLIAEANKVVGVVDDDALKAAIKSGDEAKIQAEMDRVKAKDKYQRKAKKAGNAEGTPSASSTEVVQSTGEKNIEGF